MKFAPTVFTVKLARGLRQTTLRLPRAVKAVAIGWTVAALALTNVALSKDAAAPDQGTPQEPAAHGGLEEVVVTAQKRSESLQAVPLSVEALSSEELQRRNITSLSDLMGGQVPSLRIEPFAGNPTVLEVAIRGFIDSNGVNVTNENPVPVYIDDVYYGRQTSTSLQLNEVARIEVLRGPQGTLFGRNAEGGAVRFVSRPPSGELGVRQKLETGNYGYWNTTTHLDLPSIANVATKIDFLATDNNGWQRNPAPGQNNFGRLKATAARFAALWRATDSLSVDYAYDWTQIKSTEVFNQQLKTNDLYQYLAPTFTQTIWPVQTSTATSVAHAVYRPLDPQRFTGHRATISWALSNAVTFKSISAYRDDASTLWNTASTSASLPGAFLRVAYPYLTAPAPVYDIRHNQFSQELQLVGTAERLNWVAGLFLFNEHGSQVDTTYFGAAFPNAITSGPPGFVPVVLGQSMDLDPPLLVPGSQTGALIHNKSYAVFGQATWRPAALDSRLSYTVGLRVGRDEKDAVRPVGGVYSRVTYPVPPSPFAAPPDFNCSAVPRPAQCTNDTSQTKELPLASVAYDWSKDVTSYLRYATGYQAAVVGLASQTFGTAKESTVDSFELGTKSEFFQHRARLNAAAFYTDWKDPQENVQTVSSSTVEYFSGPKIEIYGLELDGSFLPTDGLTVNVAFNYLHGSQASMLNPFPSPYVGGGSTPVSNKLFALPKYTGSVSVLYDIARTPYGTWRLDLDANGTSSYFTVPQVQTPVAAYTLLNSRLSLAEIPTGQGRMEVALWGRNLTNKSYETFIYNTPGIFALNPTQPAIGTDASFGQPRTYGVALNLTF